LIRPPKVKFFEAKKEGKIYILGVPLEVSLSFRPGVKFAPQSIREVSEVLESFSPYLEGDLEDLLFIDLGDLVLRQQKHEALQKIEDEIKRIISSEKRFLFLGGEHLITFPIIKAYKSLWPDLAVLHIDAHMDLREGYEGEKLSHATVMRRVWEIVGKNLYQLGVRSGTKEEWAFSESFCRLHPFDLSGLSLFLDEIKDKPIYLSLDLDVIDPGYLPGTGTPEAGGITPKELFEAFKLLKERKLVGVDIVELSPSYDPTGASSILAAKVVREILLLLGFSF